MGALALLALLAAGSCGAGESDPILGALSEELPGSAQGLCSLKLAREARACTAFEVVAWAAGSRPRRLAKADVYPGSARADEERRQFEALIRMAAAVRPMDGPLCDPSVDNPCGPHRELRTTVPLPEEASWPTCSGIAFDELLHGLEARSEGDRARAYLRAAFIALGRAPPTPDLADSLIAGRCRTLAVRPPAKALLDRLKALERNPNACR